MTNLVRILKNRDITFPPKVHRVKVMVFPLVTHVCESWTIRKAERRRTDASQLWLKKTLESPLNWKKIKPVNPKINQPWIFIGRTGTEAEAPILGPPDVNSQLIGKDPDSGKDWGQKEKGMTEDEMVGWHHRHNGHGFGWTLGVGDRQGSLVCCGSWGRRVRHNWATELNWNNNLKFSSAFYLLTYL